jgi:hypothetical protein
VRNLCTKTRMWQNSCRYVVTLATFSLLAMSLAWATRLHIRDAPNSGPLQVPDDGLDIGDVWENSDIQVSLPIKNVSGADVTISNFMVSCNCLSVNPPSLNIARGGIARVTLSLNLLPKLSEERGVVRTFAVSMVPQLDGSAHKAGPWHVRGSVHPLPIQIEPNAIDLGAELLPEDDIYFEKFRVSSPYHLHDVVVQDKPPYVGIVKSRLGPDAFEFNVEVDPSRLPVGPFSSVLRLRPVGEDFPKHKGVTDGIVGLSGATLCVVEATPPMLTCGPVRLGAAARATLSLSSPRSKSFAVTAWHTSDNAAIQVVQTKDRSYSISIAPREPGNCKGSVVFDVEVDASTDHKDVIEVTVPFTVYALRD